MRQFGSVFNIKMFEELHLNTSSLCSVITMNNNYTYVSRQMLRKACTYSLIQKVAWMKRMLFFPLFIYLFYYHSISKILIHFTCLRCFF